MPRLHQALLDVSIFTLNSVVSDKSLDDIIPHMANLTSTSYSIPTILAAVIELPTPTLIVIALVLLTLYCWPVWTRHRYPPGPWPLPFLGHFPWIFMSKNSSEWLAGKFPYSSFDLRKSNCSIFLIVAFFNVQKWED